MRAQVRVARNVRRLRVGLGLSQEDLAYRADLDRTYISRIERGTDNPTVAVLEKLAKALAADIADLFDVSSVARGPVRPLPSGRRKRSG